MKRIRKSLKKRSGKAILSLLLSAALAVGGMTTAFATEKDTTADETVTEETADAAVTDAANVTTSDADSTNVSADETVADKTSVGVTAGVAEDVDAAAEDASVTDEPYNAEDAVGAAEYIHTISSDYDSSYGLYGGYDGADSLDDPDTAGASVGWDLATMSAITSESGLWWIDDYYVGESDAYYTEKTDDFSLKYQIEFHASEDIAAEDVEIVIDASLGTDRNGNNIIPTELGIPYGTLEEYTPSTSSPFNYYYIDKDGNILTESEAKTAEGVKIVVWNYRDIVSGSNAVFQVLYRDLDIMTIKDGTRWALDVSASVTVEDTTESVDGNSLTGDVDTSVWLASVTKKAHVETGYSYTPEIYTMLQMSRFIDNELGEPYVDNFDDYIYIVWEVTFRGTATQPYSITIDEDTLTDEGALAGSVVGYKPVSWTNGVSYELTGSTTDGDLALTYSSSSAKTYTATFYVVTAYDAAAYEYEADIENDVTVTAYPVDGLDPEITKETSATTTWGVYEWSKEGGGPPVTINKYATRDNDFREYTYDSYLTLYEINRSKGEDTGPFYYHTKSHVEGYEFTYYTDGSQLGEHIDGSYYTTITADDAIYLYVNEETAYAPMLTEEDYYFSSVNVVVEDTGYDFWEDTTAPASRYEGVDQNVYIYAMFTDKDETQADEDGWEPVGTVAWDESGEMSYTFTRAQIAREPYRVKAVHSTADYETDCTITVGMTLRADSPTLGAYMDELGDDFVKIQLDNVSGVSAQTDDVVNNGGYFQGATGEEVAYQKFDAEGDPTLTSFNESLYGSNILLRDYAENIISHLEETASAYKGVTTENDAANSRVLANYTITAYEGYFVSDYSSVATLEGAGISLPKRNEVAYYDLLPYGMQFNANATVTAGRITTMNNSGTWRTNPNAWSTDGVTVTVGEEDVITNWNGTGRTMVIFHISYDGDDASAFYNNLWYEGFGISFQAYYDWADMNTVDAEYNIAAYVAEGVTDESQQLLGAEDGEIWKDDGSVNLETVGQQYEPFTNVSLSYGKGLLDYFYTNMYASTSTMTNVATAGTTNITKRVRADADAVADYWSRAVVENGKNYTYEITLQNETGDTLSDVVLFDRLENSVADGRPEVETSSDSVFYGLTSDEIDNYWTGTFLGVTTEALTEMGIDAVVYYNADRNATISSEDGTTTPATVLTEANGWYTEERFIEVYGDLSSVKAVAVDISKTTDGEDFVMDQDTTVSFQIHMQAPEEVAEGYLYAFNNPSYYSVATNPYDDSSTSATVIGDTVRVQIGEAGKLEVTKYFDENVTVPDSMKNQSFTFVLTRNEDILVGIEYMVYEWDEETEEWVSTGVIHSTDISGRFTLKANQKAVFSQIVDVEDVTVMEVEDPMWKTTEERDDSNLENHELVYTYTNAYRSPVYLYKTVATTDNASEEELEDAEFTFQIFVDTDGDGEYEPYANGEYVYVKEVLTDGSSPAIDTSKGESGYGTTDEEGKVILHIGDIIAFYPCDEDGNCIDVPYKIVETETGEAWNNMGNDTAEGTTSDYGTSETITNYYIYRNLIITKSLEDYDKDESLCEDEWTFKLTDANGDPVIGNHWYMIDANGDPVCDGNGDPIEGYLDNSGEFTFSGVGNGRRVVIEGLVMEERYTLTEVDYDQELYEAVNDGTVSAMMPTYAINRSIEVTNEYRLKDLSVSKLVLSKDTSADVSDHEFTFTLEKKQEDGTYVAQAGVAYTIDGSDEVYYTDDSGQFTMTTGQTALFDDIGYMEDVYRVTETVDDGYLQIYPANGDPYESALGSDGASVQFINGDFEEVASITKNLNGLDAVGSAYEGLVKSDNTVATLAGEEDDTPYTVEVTLGIYDKDGNCVTSAAGSLIDYAEDNTSYPYVYIYITADGNVTLNSYNGGEMTVTLYPYDHIYIAQIGEYIVKASESADLERVLFDVTDSTADKIGSEQILSEGEVMSGSAAAEGSITLINDISSAHMESEIYKLMTEESEDVSAGAQITFIVEIYDAASGTWSPASGIKYITMDGCTGVTRSEGILVSHDTDSSEPTSGVLVTGSDGKITLTKTENGYPYIRFIEDQVYANVYEGMTDGTLRIVESENGTDAEWGLLVGYDGEGWSGGPALNIQYADTFYNGNDDGLAFEVEKEMEAGSETDAEFTFHLVQAISSSTSPITSMDQILDSEVGANISYIIYDAETGQMIGEGTTDGSGCFTLQPGQYAVFNVPTDTTWYVYEGVNLGYPLESVEANSDKADNASIVDEVNGVVQNAKNVYASGTIILTLTDSEEGTPLAGGTFDLYKDGTVYQSGLVTDANGQIIVSGLAEGEYYFVETTVPDGHLQPASTKTSEVTIPGGLTQVTEYPVSMKNDPEPSVHYAVKLWGICRDTYSYDDGKTTDYASLTFGPATGADHLNSYVECDSDTCIHKLSWDEIISLCEEYQGNATKLNELFGSCLENGCTKGVRLEPNDTLFNMDTVNNYITQGYSGDGVSTLYYLLNGTGGTHRTYGANWNYAYSGATADDPADIYSRSRIRVTLNGDKSNIDEWFDEHPEATDWYGYDTLCDESNCLLSCFPESLQDAIVPRTTLNSGNSSSGTYQNMDTKTTYDKLFLFSVRETGASNNSTIDDGGGTDYGVNSANSNQNSNRSAYEFSNANATASATRAWWSRSRSTYDVTQPMYIIAGGSSSTTSTWACADGQGVSPGFCIK